MKATTRQEANPFSRAFRRPANSLAKSKRVAEKLPFQQTSNPHLWATSPPINQAITCHGHHSFFASYSDWLRSTKNNIYPKSPSRMPMAMPINLTYLSRLQRETTPRTKAAPLQRQPKVAQESFGLGCNHVSPTRLCGTCVHTVTY